MRFRTLPLNHRNQIGHFTQLVKDNAYAIGCSIVKFDEIDARTAMMACNYAVSNIRGCPIYDAGPTASGCQTGTKFPELCGVDEITKARSSEQVFNLEILFLFKINCTNWNTRNENKRKDSKKFIWVKHEQCKSVSVYSFGICSPNDLYLLIISYLLYLQLR